MENIITDDIKQEFLDIDFSMIEEAYDWYEIKLGGHKMQLEEGNITNKERGKIFL
jgi:hypothetical protein